MTGCLGLLSYHVVIVFNLKLLNVKRVLPCHCKSSTFFRVSQPELLLGSVKK